MTPLNLLMLALGAAFWLLYKHSKARKLKDYSYNKFFDNNFYPMLLNIVAGLAFGLSFNGKLDYTLAGFDMEKLVWFFMGYGGQFIARKVYKVFASKF